MQTITRVHKFDSSHRVMDEHMKCFRPHGHRYEAHLTFEFDDMLKIGYPIDFKEIKRIGCAWIDEFLDHNGIYNPQDMALIEAHRSTKVEPWIMSLNYTGYCNPTVENLSREIFLAMKILFQDNGLIKIKKVKLFETENCSSTCYDGSIPKIEEFSFNRVNKDKIMAFSSKTQK